MIHRIALPNLTLLAVTMLWLSPLAWAQAPAPGASPSASAPGSEALSSPAEKSAGDVATGTKATQNDRIFFALPNYLTVENASAMPPLSTTQKFKAVAEGCFDPVEFVFIGIQAGMGQADDVNPSYGQGFSGYSKRFGTSYADAIIGNFGTSAVFPTLLHQDPRYYQMGKGNFFRRFGYAAVRVLVTRSEKTERPQFNFSEVLGNGVAAGFSNAYHPGPHTIISSANVFGTQVVMDAAGYELKEFWPDIHHFLTRAKRRT